MRLGLTSLEAMGISISRSPASRNAEDQLGVEHRAPEPARGDVGSDRIPPEELDAVSVGYGQPEQRAEHSGIHPAGRAPEPGPGVGAGLDVFGTQHRVMRFDALQRCLQEAEIRKIDGTVKNITAACCLEAAFQCQAVVCQRGVNDSYLRAAGGDGIRHFP